MEHEFSGLCSQIESTTFFGEAMQSVALGTMTARDAVEYIDEQLQEQIAILEKYPLSTGKEHPYASLCNTIWRFLYSIAQLNSKVMSVAQKMFKFRQIRRCRYYQISRIPASIRVDKG